MRIAFITNPDGWEVPVYVAALKKVKHSTVGVLVPLSPKPLLTRLRHRRQGGRHRLQLSERRMLLAAWSARSRRFLRDYSALRVYCRQHRIPLMHVWSLSASRARRFLKTLKPDVLFTASLSHWVPQGLLQIPRRAAVNIHGGLLPEYGGLASAYWAVHDRQENAGITFHTLTERFDSGRIILRRSIPMIPRLAVLGAKRRGRRSLKVRGARTPEAVAEKLIRLAADALPECVERIRAGRFETRTVVRSRLRPAPRRIDPVAPR